MGRPARDRRSSGGVRRCRRCRRHLPDTFRQRGVGVSPPYRGDTPGRHPEWPDTSALRERSGRFPRGISRRGDPCALVAGRLYPLLRSRRSTELMATPVATVAVPGASALLAECLRRDSGRTLNPPVRSVRCRWRCPTHLPSTRRRRSAARHGRVTDGAPRTCSAADVRSPGRRPPRALAGRPAGLRTS